MIVKGIEDALLEVTQNFSCYTIDNSRNAVFDLSAFALIAANSIEELIKKEKKCSSSKAQVKDKFLEILTNKFDTLRNDPALRKDFENKLEDNLYILCLKPKLISKSPIIQFIYWAVKNVRKFIISPAKEKNATESLILLPKETNVILSSYFEVVFSTISEFRSKKEELNICNKKIYSFLLNTFVDKIVNWKFYYENVM